MFHALLVHAIGEWKSDNVFYEKESAEAFDRLAYIEYARALSDLIKTGKDGSLPTVVGVYAPWGSGKVRWWRDKTHEHERWCGNYSSVAVILHVVPRAFPFRRGTLR